MHASNALLKNNGVKLLSIAGVFFTLACADTVSLKFGDASVRLFYTAALLLPILFKSARRVERRLLIYLVTFILLISPSIVFSIAPIRSILYTIWIIATIASCYFLARILAENSKETFQSQWGNQDLLDGFIIRAYRLQLIVAFALFATKIHERPTFLYYEPSYFSISLSIYVALTLQNFLKKEKYILDAFLILIYAATSFSASFLIVCALIFILHFDRRRLLLSITAIIVLFILGALYVTYVDDINTEIIKGLVNGNIGIFELMLRGGNRLPRIFIAYDTFISNPINGIGLGTFEQYSQHLILPSIFEDNEYMVVNGLPAVNIYLEIAATAGLLGLIGFIIFLYPVLHWGIKDKFRSPYFCALICMLLILAFESNYLRPYFWVCFFICWMQSRGKLINEKKNTLL